MNKKRAEWIAACPVRQYAAERNMSLGAFARALGMTRQSVAQWLIGRPPGPRGRAELAHFSGRTESQVFCDFVSWLAEVPPERKTKKCRK